MTQLLYKELTGAIIGAYYEVYNHTSRTLPEYLYERAMLEELRRRGYPTTRQDEYHIFYKERLVGVQRLDMFVVKEIVVENKVADQLNMLHRAQAHSYLKTTGKNVGLLFNFGGKEPEFDRLYCNPAERISTQTELKESTPSADWLYPALTHTIIGGLHEVFSLLGPGFVHRICANACHHELRLLGLGAKPIKRMQVAYKDTVIGDVAFAHLVVESQVIVFPIALRDIQAIHLDNLKAWLRICNIQLGILANFNNIRLETIFIRV